MNKNNCNFIREQGNYLMSDQDNDFRWKARAKLKNEKLFRKSKRYNSNFCLNNDNNRPPGAPWSLIDTTR
jgi:hypothetical protein